MAALTETKQAMKLSKLVEKIPDARVVGDADATITSLATDSRHVTPGALFVALRGTRADGHDFVAAALEAGAAAAVTEVPAPGGDAPNVVVPNTARALAEIAAEFFGRPADALELVGITGTNGKTSTAHMLCAIINASNWGGAGLVGTLGHGPAGDLSQTVHTTPDAVTLHEVLRRIADQERRGVVMEVSSHAVRQHRVWGLDFTVGILTNVTRDHLDYHHTIEDYRLAKREFCDALVGEHRHKPDGMLVYCVDDEIARQIGEGFAGDKMTVSTGTPADVYADNVRATLDATRFDLHIGGESTAIEMSLLGAFCATNAALAAAGATALGIELGAIQAGLQSITQIPGRFEALGGSGRPVVIVDYSHTPDAMRRVLETCRALGPKRLATVFGCGGDRDRSKRPLMGAVATELSDVVYVTMDNPRSESVDDIIAEIVAGAVVGGADVRVQVDRATAIAEAVSSSRGGDVVALLGKGHEDYQLVGEDRLYFSDKEQAEGALQKWRAR